MIVVMGVHTPCSFGGSLNHSAHPRAVLGSRGGSPPESWQPFRSWVCGSVVSVLFPGELTLVATAIDFAPRPPIAPTPLIVDVIGIKSRKGGTWKQLLREGAVLNGN
jgi:hypothetical protein